ncbi:GNAT family N-acetyltransferase [Gallibacterium anatis]|uniref:GNAT family N-acetyltransferase n=1 Tax=Gallibacterium anatis TaxID=750 RepID=UPI002231D8FB|nr:GNAT family N-acetyltransferase [Gallibacterium anatis]UZD15561.1 GNAT family N-acetyltransferase [Gallibacterium anatis]
MLQLRAYITSDCEKLIKLFYQTVHTVNAKDYTKEQLNVWAPDNINSLEWNESFLKNYTIVAIDNDEIVGFGDIDKTGYLDRLFVHKDHQRKGIASVICNKLEQSIKNMKITTATSITAKAFFEQRGYRIVKKQEVIRRGVGLINFLMEKYFSDVIKVSIHF